MTRWKFYKTTVIEFQDMLELISETQDERLSFSIEEI